MQQSGHKSVSTLPALTGVRFYLAAFVVVFHFGQESLSRFPVVVRNFAGAGYVSVSMFFLLSGYVLARSYGNIHPKERSSFWVARFARVAPAYYTAAAISLVIWTYSFYRGAAVFSWATSAIALTCANAWSLKAEHLWNFPAWSLTCEWFFYLIFPFLVSRIQRFGRTQLKWAIAFFGVLVVLPPLFYLAWRPDGIGLSLLSQSHITHEPFQDPGVRKTLGDGIYKYFQFLPLAHLPVFLLGVALGRYRVLFGGPRDALLGKVCVHLSILLMFLVLACAGWLPHLLLHNALLALCFAGFVYYVESLWKPLGNLLSSPLGLLLGEASYSLYILQVPLNDYLVPVLGKLHIANSGLWSIPIRVGVFTLASVIVFRKIEIPARVWIKSKWSARVQSAAH